MIDVGAGFTPAQNRATARAAPTKNGSPENSNDFIVLNDKTPSLQQFLNLLVSPNLPITRMTGAGRPEILLRQDLSLKGETRMKKLATALCVVLVVFAFSAWAGTPTPGKYQSTIVSVNPTFNGQTATAEVKTEGTKSIATVLFSDAKEVWTWDGTTLLQQEYDLTTNQPTKQYTATNKDGKYVLACKDTTNNTCDGDKDLDARTYWTINTGSNSFTYTVYGVDSAKKADAAAQPVKRHEIVFNTAK